MACWRRLRRSREVWQEFALCRGKVDVMFPADGDYREAKRLCAECPVREVCREHADGQYGMWGGVVGSTERVDPNDRRRACLHCGAPAPSLIRRGGRWCGIVCWRRWREGAGAEPPTGVASTT